MNEWAEKAVANGVALFIGEGIDNWAELLDINTLDMWSGSLCVAGQVFGAVGKLSGGECGCCDATGYGYACHILLGKKENPVQFGFCPGYYSETEGGTHMSPEELVEAWSAAKEKALASV